MDRLVRFWQLAKPFWLQSERRYAAWGLLLVVMGLSLSTVGFSVRLNTWNGAFFNAIQAMDAESVYGLLFEFVMIVSLFVLVLVYGDWLQKKLLIEWRDWMTRHYLGLWLADDARHYRLQLLGLEPENPDQRLQEDIRLLVEESLSLLISFARSIVTLVSFVTILWSLSGGFHFSFAGVSFTIPGYMVWVCLLYTLLATAVTHRIGRPLMALNFEQQRREADFRSALVQVKTHAEAVAGLHGEANERGRLHGLFEAVVDNWHQLMNRQRNLAFFTVGFGQVTQLVPIFFALPAFLAGTIQLGGLMQIRLAFGQVATAVGWFIYAYRDIAQWSATVDRLSQFEKALRVSLPSIESQSGQAVRFSGTIADREGRVLLEKTTVAALPGQITVIKGRSGIGKSTLLKALAGVWPWIHGDLTCVRHAWWVSQQTWLPPIPLADLLAYPRPAEAFSREALAEVLRAVGLGDRVEQLDDPAGRDWQRAFSGGECQRVLIARAILNRPAVLLLDETLSGLDDDAVVRMINLLRERLPESAILLVSHQSAAHSAANRLFDMGINT